MGLVCLLIMHALIIAMRCVLAPWGLVISHSSPRNLRAVSLHPIIVKTFSCFALSQAAKASHQGLLHPSLLTTRHFSRLVTSHDDLVLLGQGVDEADV